MEAGGRIELPNTGFAVPCITTLLPSPTHYYAKDYIGADAAAGQDANRLFYVRQEGFPAIHLIFQLCIPQNRM